MTNGEIADLIQQVTAYETNGHLGTRVQVRYEALRDAILSLIAAERERCARIVAAAAAEDIGGLRLHAIVAKIREG